MKLKKEKTDRLLTVKIEGSLDVKTSPQLAEALEGEPEDADMVVFDLKDTAYTSSAGLRVILQVYQEMHKKGGRMVLRNVNQDFKTILTEAGFTRFLEIEE